MIPSLVLGKQRRCDFDRSRSHAPVYKQTMLLKNSLLHKAPSNRTFQLGREVTFLLEYHSGTDRGCIIRHNATAIYLLAVSYGLLFAMMSDNYSHLHASVALFPMS